MKTTDATVLDEPKIHDPRAEAVIEPAVESRPRRTTGVKEAKIYIDGKYYDEANAKISVFDHGLLYGDGIFEGIRAYNGRVFKLKEHIDRLFCSARSILLTIPLTHAEVMKAVIVTCRRNQIHDGYVRLLVTRGVGTLGLNPHRCKRPSVVIVADKIQLYPPELYVKGMA